MEYIIWGTVFTIAAVVLVWLGVRRRQSVKKGYERDVKKYTASTMMKVVWIDESEVERWEDREDGSSVLTRETFYLPTYEYTVDGRTYPLQKPFAVIATQNNVGTAGTQLLPYAQMDRFLVRLSIGYPDYEAQMSILRDRQSTDPIGSVAQVVTRDDVLRMQAEVRAVTAKDSILDYITRLAMASREHPMVEVGISPRGTLFLDRMAKAHAYLEGRDYVTGGDVQAVFHDVCAHRVILSQKSRLSGAAVPQVLNELLETVEVPDRRQA